MCPYAGKPKILFNSEAKALRFITWNADEIANMHGHCPIRAYYCSACGGWHVTSRGKRHQPGNWNSTMTIYESEPLCNVTTQIAKMLGMLHNGQYEPCYTKLEETIAIFLSLPSIVRNNKQGKETKRMLLSIVERLGKAMKTAA